MTLRRCTAEHPFGTIKAWMGATHVLTRRLPNVRTETARNVLAYNFKGDEGMRRISGMGSRSRPVGNFAWLMEAFLSAVAVYLQTRNRRR